jgi:RNA polymerase sigma-70 factor, ECF subfamily
MAGRSLRDDDADLAARASRGERRALETLLDRHADRVHALCRRVIAHREDALDATQEAMIAIARGIDRFDGRSAFTTWTYRVVTNAALDELRRKQRRPEPVDTTLYDRPAPGPTLDHGVTERVDIDAALATVPTDFRVAVVLRDLLDLDYAQIAEVLEVPPGTVRSRIARGRALLAAALGNPDAPSERLNSDG